MEDIRIDYICSECGSDGIEFQGSVCWNSQKQSMEVCTHFDECQCIECDAENTAVEVIIPSTKRVCSNCKRSDGLRYSGDIRFNDNTKEYEVSKIVVDCINCITPDYTVFEDIDHKLEQVGEAPEELREYPVDWECSKCAHTYDMNEENVCPECGALP